MDTIEHVFEGDQTLCSVFITHSRLNNQHNRGHIYDHCFRQRIFTIRYSHKLWSLWRKWRRAQFEIACVPYPTRSGCRVKCVRLRPTYLIYMPYKGEKEKNLTYAWKQNTKSSAGSSLHKPWKLLSSTHCLNSTFYMNVWSIAIAPRL